MDVRFIEGAGGSSGSGRGAGGARRTGRGRTAAGGGRRPGLLRRAVNRIRGRR